MEDAQTRIGNPDSLEVESTDHTTAYAAQLYFDVTPTSVYHCQRQFKGPDQVLLRVCAPQFRVKDTFCLRIYVNLQQ